MEGGEQLGLCVTPDKASAPLLFGFFTAPRSVVGPGDGGGNGAGRGHPWSAWASDKHQDTEGR